MEKRCKFLPVREFVIDTLKMEYKEEMEEKYGKDGLLEFGEKFGKAMYDAKRNETNLESYFAREAYQRIPKIFDE